MNLHHCGALRRENAAAKGERIIEEALQRLGWKESDSAGHPKSDPDKFGDGAAVEAGNHDVHQRDRRPGATGQSEECECGTWLHA